MYTSFTSSILSTFEGTARYIRLPIIIADTLNSEQIWLLITGKYPLKLSLQKGISRLTFLVYCLLAGLHATINVSNGLSLSNWQTTTNINHAALRNGNVFCVTVPFVGESVGGFPNGQWWGGLFSLLLAWTSNLIDQSLLIWAVMALISAIGWLNHYLISRFYYRIITDKLWRGGLHVRAAPSGKPVIVHYCSSVRYNQFHILPLMMHKELTMQLIKWSKKLSYRLTTLFIFLETHFFSVAPQL